MRKTIDQVLLSECLANDRRAQRELYDRSFPHLNFMIGRYLRNSNEREDVLQETYLRIFRHLGDFNPGKAGFATWSGRIAINCCLRRNDADKVRSTEAFRLDAHDTGQPPEVLEELTDAELLCWLQTMPIDLYTVFSLHAIDGFSHREIGGKLDITAALSRQRLSRARKWLRNALQREDAPQLLQRRATDNLQLAPLIALLYLLTKI